MRKQRAGDLENRAFVEGEEEEWGETNEIRNLPSAAGGSRRAG